MRLSKDHWLLSKPIAHRGLWNEKICENSLNAYENAAKAGFPIEIDVYSSSDGELFSFHDKSLKRMTGEEGFIFEKSSSKLKSLRLCDGNDKIPTLSEVFEITEKRTPLLIEIKNQPDKTVVQKLIKALKGYKGEFAVQSFNPFYIKTVKKLSPEIIRGILGTNDAKEENRINKWVVKNLPFNRLITPDFISYDKNGLSLLKGKSKKIPVIAWTITDKNQETAARKVASNVIFERYVPHI